MTPVRPGRRRDAVAYDPAVRVRRVVISVGLGLALVVPAVAAGGTSPAVAASARVKPSAGCKATPLAAGAEDVTTMSGGTPRTYLRTVPPSYDGKTPTALVVDLHGYLEGAHLHETNSQLGAFGTTHGFVTLTPQGSGDVAPGWDVEPGSRDTHYVNDLIDEAERTLCVDEHRVYLAGYSNGAFLASTLVCTDARRIAAIATVSGLMDPPGCKPARPVPIVAFQGTGDEFVAFTGGLGARAKVTSANDGTGRMLGDTSGGQAVARSKSTPEVAAAWAKRNHCTRKATETSVALDVTLIRYRCPNRADVELYRIEGGGHTWPGSEFSRAIESAVGPTTFSINADDVLWRFFQARPQR
jgi:polyhydroxybutyrate depolymerase